MTLTTAQRGYGGPHQRTRAQWEPIVAQGHTLCAQPICLMPTRTIHPWQRWDLGHTTNRDAYIGPCHMRCNRIDGARRNRTHRHGRLPIW